MAIETEKKYGNLGGFYQLKYVDKKNIIQIGDKIENLLSNFIVNTNSAIEEIIAIWDGFDCEMKQSFTKEGERWEVTLKAKLAKNSAELSTLIYDKLRGKRVALLLSDMNGNIRFFGEKDCFMKLSDDSEINVRNKNMREITFKGSFRQNPAYLKTEKVYNFDEMYLSTQDGYYLTANDELIKVNL